MDDKFNKDSVLTGISPKKLENAAQQTDVMSENDKKLVRMCQEIFEYAKRHREVPMERAAKNYLVYVGKQWDMNKPSFKTVPVTNIIWGIIEYEVPLMTENKPIMRAHPRSNSDLPYAEGATKGLEYVWDSNDMTFRLPFIMRDVLIFGDTFLKVYWDYEIEEIIIDDVEPDYLYPEPFQSDIKKCKYVIHAEPRAMYDVAEAYPNGKFVKQEDISSPLAEAIDEEVNNYMHETQESLEAEGETVSPEGRMFAGRALVKEMWIDDKTMLSRKQVIQGPTGEPLWDVDDDGEFKLDDDGQRIPKYILVKERKYPHGRFIVWSGGILLADMPSPYEHGRAPYVHFHNVKVKRSFWSYGDPYQLIAIQQQLNKRKAQIDFMADQTGNSIWVVDADAGVRRHQLTNQPGLVVYKRPGTDVHREPGPPIPQYMFENLKALEKEAEFVSGVQGVITGEKPGSVTAGTAIAELIERAMVRIKEKVKYMESSIVDLGRMSMSYMRQYWEDTKEFQIIGSTLQNAQGESRTVEFSGKSLSMDPDIKVVAGSTMPTSKTTKFEQAVIMLNSQVIDRQEFLEYIEYPNAEAVLQRLNQQEKEMQQMQQQSDDKEYQLKMANYLARIKSAQIGAQNKLDTQEVMNQGRIGQQYVANEGGVQRQDSANQGKMQEGIFDFNKEVLLNDNYLLGPTNRGVVTSPQGV